MITSTTPVLNLDMDRPNGSNTTYRLPSPARRIISTVLNGVQRKVKDPDLSL